MIYLVAQLPLKITDFPILIVFVLILILLFKKALDAIIPEEQRIPLITSVFWAGFLIRLIIIAASEVLKNHPDFASVYGHLAGDESVYCRWANNFVRRYAEGDETIVVTGFKHSSFYLVLNALVFYIFGYKPIFMKLINCVAGMSLSLVVYRISSLLFNRAVCTRAMIITHLFPSLMLWSCLGIREIWVVLFVMLVLYYAVRLKTLVPDYKSFLLLAVSLILLSQLRSGTFMVLLIALLPSLIISRATKLMTGFVVSSFVLIGFFIFIVYLGVGQEFISEDPMEQMLKIKTDLSGGDAAYFTRDELKEIDNPIYIMPKGLVYFMFSPFPWELTKSSRILAFIDVMFIYMLTLFFIVSLIKLIRYRYWEALPVLVFFFFLLFAFSMVEGNFGTAFRHRAQILPIFVLISSIALPFFNTSSHVEIREYSEEADGF